MLDHKQFTRSFISSIRGAIKRPDGVVNLSEPVFGPKASIYVEECIKTAWVSSEGQFVKSFELELEKITQCKKAVATVNGTSALHLALIVLGIKPSEEVLTTPLTFVATANAIAHAGAIPHFVDVEEESLGIDPEKLDRYLATKFSIKDGALYNQLTGRKVSAIIPMHVFGYSSRISEIVAVAKKYHLWVIEDAAEAIGSTVNGKHLGTFGDIGILSFNGNKLITTGGGGALLFNDESLGLFAKHLSTTAKVPHPFRYSHDHVGYNYRMPNLNAALGLAQLEEISSLLESKKKLAQRYETAFGDLPGGKLFSPPYSSESNHWLFAFIIDEELAQFRDDILQLCHDAGLKLRPAWDLMPELPMYRAAPSDDLTTARRLVRRIINIPSSYYLGS